MTLSLISELMKRTNGKIPKNIGSLENPECLKDYENIEELKN